MTRADFLTLCSTVTADVQAETITGRDGQPLGRIRRNLAAGRPWLSVRQYGIAPWDDWAEHDTRDAAVARLRGMDRSAA